METPRFVRGDIPTLSCRVVASISTKVKEETPHLRSGRQKGEVRGDKKEKFGATNKEKFGAAKRINSGDKKRAFEEIKGGVLNDKKGGRGHRGGSR